MVSEEIAASVFRVVKRQKRAAYFSNTCVHIYQMFGFTSLKTVLALKEKKWGNIFSSLLVPELK
jgi:hypothetical protein